MHLLVIIQQFGHLISMDNLHLHSLVHKLFKWKWHFAPVDSNNPLKVRLHQLLHEVVKHRGLRELRYKKLSCILWLLGWICHIHHPLWLFYPNHRIYIAVAEGRYSDCTSLKSEVNNTTSQCSVQVEWVRQHGLLDLRMLIHQNARNNFFDFPGKGTLLLLL